MAKFPPEVQERMQILRTCIRKAAPKADEIISYQMPAYKFEKVLVYFAAYKNHIGFYPTSEPIVVFAEELNEYKHSKGAVQFAHDKPLPLNLIKKMVKYRLWMVQDGRME